MLELAVAVALIALNGVFALSELAVVSSRRARLTAMAEARKSGALAALARSTVTLTGLALPVVLAGVGGLLSALLRSLLLRLLLATTLLLSLVGVLSEFLLGSIFLTSDENKTLAVGLYVWGSDERNAPWGLFAAGAVKG